MNVAYKHFCISLLSTCGILNELVKNDEAWVVTVQTRYWSQLPTGRFPSEMASFTPPEAELDATSSSLMPNLAAENSQFGNNGEFIAGSQQSKDIKNPNHCFLLTYDFQS